MPGTQLAISEILGELKELATAGYAIGLQVNYTTPKFMFQSYSKEWLDYYAQNGLLVQDPTVAWGFENVGAVRWSTLADQDTVGVLSKAAAFGINFGISCAKESLDNDGIRSMGSFARNDRDFTDEELALVRRGFDALHDGTENQAQLSPEVVQQLRNMSIMVTHPGS